MTSKLMLRSVQLGTPRNPKEGLRIGTVRFLPRGVRKQDYAKQDFFDVWLPSLSPSRDLLSQLKHNELSLPRFFARYRSEMSESEPRQTIELLAEMAKRTPISVGCYCNNESKCHRSILAELIRSTGGEVINSDALAGTCIYTIAHYEKLNEALSKGGTLVFKETRTWTEGKRLFDQACARGDLMPIVFADATDCSKLTHWAILRNIAPTPDGTSYTFTDIRKMPRGYTPQDLELRSTGKPIADNFIRPYAICATPRFLR